MIYIGLPVCNISTLIVPVLDKLFLNTSNKFHLNICDNYSSDNTVSVIEDYLSNLDSLLYSKLCNLTFTRLSKRDCSTVCINQSLSLALSEPYDMVVKMDHDYGVPLGWDTIILDNLPQYKLLSPSVVPETPKGMQFYSAGHAPQKVTKLSSGHTLYHYDGIAGYCHCFSQDTLSRLKRYSPLNAGAVFGSEDADWSLRCGSVSEKGYIFELQGHHWNKDEIGSWEDKWKGECTFLKTTLQWEDWAKINLPESLREKYL